MPYNDQFTFTHVQVRDDFDASHEVFQRYGVAVVSDVYTPQECDVHTDGILSAFEKLGTGVLRDKVDTWMTKPRNLVPTQTRVGLYQQAFSNLPRVWEIRSDTRLVSFFALLYGDHRLIVSGDGINVMVNGRAKTLNPNKDWAHLDSVGPFDGCIQGQVVLTDTAAAFR